MKRDISKVVEQMKELIEQYINEMQNALTIAGLNYDIWWFYKEKENRKRLVDTLNSYPLFFQTSLHAHFLAMIIALYRLFETRTDTINMHQLIDLFKKEGTIPIEEIEEIEGEIKEIKPLWVKVTILRNKLFGHKSNALDNDDIWKLANVTSNDINDLIDNSKRILNELTNKWNKSGHAFNLSATEDTLQLLLDLSELDDGRAN